MKTRLKDRQARAPAAVKAVLFFIFWYLPHTAEAQLDLFVPADMQKRLLTGEILSSADFDKIEPRLMPRYEALQTTVAGLKTETGPSLIVESLCLYKKPVQKTAWTAQEKTALFNGIVALGTLSGLKYYSASRKQMRLFYESSQVIDSPESQNPVHDPVFTVQTLPSSLTLYAKQKDLTFGENIYRFDFTLKDDAIMFTQTNHSTMFYGIIPVLGKNKLRSIAAALDAGEYILIYVVSMADAFPVPGMKNRVRASFAARSEAALRWFAEKAGAAY